MNFVKIIVIGNGGSGKSYFSERLGKILEYDVIHLDQYYWKENGNRIEENQWKTIHASLVNRKAWIIEGTQLRELDYRIKNADLIIFLQTNLLLNIIRVLRKHIRKNTNFGFPTNKHILLTIFWLFKFEFFYKSTIKRKIIKSNKKFFYLKGKKKINQFLECITIFANK